ncbi:NAD(P)-binding protein [Aspergillus lucknowensis]|uniref:NAD(P)-binding protein n=1 Tax=Aspergillus lucknowensis TaxID=176173 RepID=A0ABR4LSG1_9EURO
MATRIFVTGTTGFLGGTTLNLLLTAFPDASYSALVRTSEQADALTSAHPAVTPVIGDISSTEIVVPAAAAADIVIDIAGDNDAGIRNILAGLASRPQKGTLIHVSGITCLLDPANLKLGHATPRTFGDVDDMAEILSFGPDREHAALDQFVLRAGDMGVKSVILSSCQILGHGAGYWKQESFGHGYVKTVLGRGKAFTVEQGGNVWSWCSVGDVSSAIGFVLEKVLNGSSDLQFGQDGYYFVQTGEVSFKQQAQAAATKLKELGKLETDTVDELTVAQATEIHPYAGLLWGASCRSRADRLKALGWTPKETDWKILMEEVAAAAV